MAEYDPRRLIPRRSAYRESIRRADYFAVRNLGRFLLDEISTLVRPGDKVADVGCGEQPLRTAIEARGGNYTGIDITQNAQGTVDVIADINALPLQNGAFDFVICSEVLEHVATPYEALDELARILRPGGTLLVSVPFAYPLHEVPYDFLRYTPYFFARWAEQHEFEIVRTAPLGHTLQVWATVWGHLWTPQATDPVAWRTLLTLVRLPVNLLTALLDPVAERLASRRYYLTLGLVFRKRHREAQ